MNEHWQLFVALLGVMAVWIGLIVTVFQIMLSRVMKSQTDTLEVKINVIKTVSDNCTRLERELLEFKADMPAEYVRREDFIRFDVGQGPESEFADPYANPYDNTVIDIPEISFSEKTVKLVENQNEFLNVFPNPANNSAILNYGLVNDQIVEIFLYNTLAENVLNVINGYELSGSHFKTIDISSLNEGVYCLKMVLGNNKIISRKLVIVR